MTLDEFIAEDRAALLAALEKATAPDHELHHRIAWHMLPDHQRQLRDGIRQGLHMALPTPRWLDYDHPAWCAPLFMRSLDAANGLRLPGYLYNLGHDPDDPARLRASVMAPAWPCPVAVGHSPMDATALALAWLRARWTPVMPEAAHA
jgi:hypothetical protein